MKLMQEIEFQKMLRNLRKNSKKAYFAQERTKKGTWEVAHEQLLFLLMLQPSLTPVSDIGEGEKTQMFRLKKTDSTVLYNCLDFDFPYHTPYRYGYRQ